MNTEKLEEVAATGIIGQKVLPGLEREYVAWQEGVNAAAADYAGYLGAEISRPTPLQPDWVVVYRFDSIAHLQAWINSATRQRLLDIGSKYFDGPATQQVVSGGAQPTDPLVMSFLTMPYYVNPLLKRWLRPSPDEPAARTNRVGLGIVAAVTVFWGVVFYLVTTQIWTLP